MNTNGTSEPIHRGRAAIHGCLPKKDDFPCILRPLRATRLIVIGRPDLAERRVLFALWWLLLPFLQYGNDLRLQVEVYTESNESSDETE